MSFFLVPAVGSAQPVEETGNNPFDGYVGVGFISIPAYTGSAETRIFPIPIARIEYRETAYLYVDRLGVRLWHNDAKTIALGVAGEPRFGYQAKNDPWLAGMSTRHDSLETGPVAEWQLPAVALSLAYFTDITGVDGGQSLHFSVYRQWLDNDRWDVGSYLDLDYSNSTITRYYFGVQASEATVSRPYYQPGASLNATLGLAGAYKFDKKYALLFGGEINRLGAVAAESPITQRRTLFMGYFGIGLIF